MRFIYSGDHHSLRSDIGPLGRDMTYVDAGGVLIVHMDADAHCVVYVSNLENATVFPEINSPVSDVHATLLAKHGIKKGDTVRDALNKIHAKYPSHITDTSLPLS